MLAGKKRLERLEGNLCSSHSAAGFMIPVMPWLRLSRVWGIASCCGFSQKLWETKKLPWRCQAFNEKKGTVNINILCWNCYSYSWLNFFSSQWISFDFLPLCVLAPFCLVNSSLSKHWSLCPPWSLSVEVAFLPALSLYEKANFYPSSLSFLTPLTCLSFIMCYLEIPVLFGLYFLIFSLSVTF